MKSTAAGDARRWPDPSEFLRLSDDIGSADLPAPGPRSRLTDGVGHARMLSTVLPTARTVLDDIAARLEAAGPPPIDAVVHGDLHEGQVVVADRRIVGVLDVDDAGPGAAVDDLANLLARLHYREETGTGPVARLAAYRTRLHDLACVQHEPERLDLHTAAALVGLATGPFRIQSDGWRDDVARLVERAASLP